MVAFPEETGAEDETTEAVVDPIDIDEDDDALTETTEDELVEAVVWATEEFDPPTETGEDELIEAVVWAAVVFDALIEVLETATEEFEYDEVVDMVVTGAELLATDVVPFWETDDVVTLDSVEEEGSEPVVRTMLWEVVLLCVVVFANIAVVVLRNWAEAEPIKARTDTNTAVFILTWG
jgi:hypothetical protein